MFQQTPEQKAYFEELNRKRNEELEARKAAEANAAIERQKTIEANRKLSEELAAQRQQQPAARTIQAGKRTLEIGKLYSLKGYDFRVFDPNSLTEKQQVAVARMLREWEVLTVIGLPGGLKVEDFYPFIDVMFAFNRREITEAMFFEVTGINLNLSTFNRLSDHDL